MNESISLVFLFFLHSASLPDTQCLLYLINFSVSIMMADKCALKNFMWPCKFVLFMKKNSLSKPKTILIRHSFVFRRSAWSFSFRPLTIINIYIYTVCSFLWNVHLNEHAHIDNRRHTNFGNPVGGREEMRSYLQKTMLYCRCLLVFDGFF